MKHSKKLVVGVIFLLMMGFVTAYILDMHVALNEQALTETQSSAITQRIMPYKDYFMLGVEIPDISVVTYFDKSCQDATGFERFICPFKFNIGKPYTASHSISACLRAIDISNQEADPIMRDKEYAVAMGWCTHILQDADSHNHFVNLVIQRSFLFNGLVHSPAEIWLKDQVTNEHDKVYTRQVLDLSYEMTPFVEKVLVNDPAYSDIKIPQLIDFFTKQVQANSEYKLGFQSFFALPSYVLWLFGILFLLSITLFALSLRRILGGERDIPVLFTSFLSLGIFLFVTLAIYGVLTANVWSYWETVSQLVFSNWMYLFIGTFLIIGSWLVYDFIKKKDKKQRIPNILVALFLILLGLALLPLPNSLHAVNPQTQFQLSLDHTKAFLTQGVPYIRGIQDPSGFVSLHEADSANSGVRSIFMIALVGLLISILYFTFRRKRK